MQRLPSTPPPVLPEPALAESVEPIRAAIATGHIGAMEDALHRVAEDLVAAATHAEPAQADRLHAALDALHVQLAQTSFGPEADRPQIHEALGQVHALAMVASVIALRRPEQGRRGELPPSPVYVPILKLLLDCDAPMSNRDIATSLGLSVRAVSRRMPCLRAAALVVGVAQGGGWINRLTAEGRRVARSI